MARRRSQEGGSLPTRVTICLLALILTTAIAETQGQPRRRVQTGAVSATEVDVQQMSALTLARLKYSGGGDWYNDQSAEVNLLRYVAQNTSIAVNPVYTFVDLASDNVFQYPVLFMTGHGTVNFSASEARRLRAYLENGGFLYIDDDYGMNASIRRELKKVFPDQDLVELPFDHPIYHCHFSFPSGPPKIHEHDGKPAQGFGLFVDGRLCVYYTYESNPGDGWADPNVHQDPPEKREAALRMGTNIIVYALTR